MHGTYRIRGTKQSTEKIDHDLMRTSTEKKQMNGYCNQFICKVNKRVNKSTSSMYVQYCKEGRDFQNLFQNEWITFSDGSVSDPVDSAVGSFVDLLVGPVARETEDEACTTTEVLLGTTALTTDVALLITADEDEKT